jgi:hypothetical protein
MGWWSTPRPDRFTPGKDSVHIVYKDGCASGVVWTGAENLAPTGIRSPDSPTRSEPLYRLTYPGLTYGRKAQIIIHRFNKSKAKVMKIL